MDLTLGVAITDFKKKMGETSRRANQNSLLASASYVGIATVAILCSYPPYYGDWVLLVLLLTLPVSVLGFGIMYAGPEYYLIVIGIQLIIFFVVWRLLYRYLLKKYNN